jgi:hypothetical protein
MSTVESESVTSATEPRIRIKLGWGVVGYVRRRGGTLFVWGDPFGGGFDRLKAGTSPPEGDNEFVRYEPVTEVALYVETYLLDATRLRVARRWWHLQGGLIAESGFVMGGTAGG